MRSRNFTAIDTASDSKVVCLQPRAHVALTEPYNGEILPDKLNLKSGHLLDLIASSCEKAERADATMRAGPCVVRTRESDEGLL
jgi:hypothetical protein